MEGTLFCVRAAAWPQSNPLKVATAARFDLFGADTGPLTNGYTRAGDGCVSELCNLLLPDNDSNLIVTVHCYGAFSQSAPGGRR